MRGRTKGNSSVEVLRPGHILTFGPHSGRLCESTTRSVGRNYHRSAASQEQAKIGQSAYGGAVWSAL